MIDVILLSENLEEILGNSFLVKTLCYLSVAHYEHGILDLLDLYLRDFLCLKQMLIPLLKFFELGLFENDLIETLRG